MADSTSIQGPVSIQSDSRHRVALELMQLIARSDVEKTLNRDRKYWFTLYRQSLLAVNGSDVAAILQESSRS